MKKTAPIFNRQGYIGTSLSDLTKATGLTKGAIYCNFVNKEDLALKAFQLNVKAVVYPIFELINRQENNLNKLRAISTYHRSYYQIAKRIGGCPMLRVGIDTKFINPSLFKAAKKLSKQFLNGLMYIIDEGKKNGEFNKKIDTIETSKNILSLIEGSTVLAFTHDDDKFMVHAMDFLEKELIERIRV